MSDLQQTVRQADPPTLQRKYGCALSAASSAFSNSSALARSRERAALRRDATRAAANAHLSDLEARRAKREGEMKKEGASHAV